MNAIGFRFSIQGLAKPGRNSSFHIRIVSNDQTRVESILREMTSVVDDEGYASIVTLRDLSEVDRRVGHDHEYENHWGWVSVRTAVILETDEGFVLSLPPALLIDGGSKS